MSEARGARREAGGARRESGTRGARGRHGIAWCCAVGTAVCLAIPACGRKAVSFPTGAGTPFPEFASAYEQASAPCRSTRTVTVSMALSGKAGETKLRGRIDAGFAAPGRMRLEGRAPFGRPVFVLTAADNRATLVLPRDERVLTHTPPDQIVEALAGVPLDPDTLRTIVSGCGLTTVPPSAGDTYDGGWTAVRQEDVTTYLRSSGSAWQLAGATRDKLTVSYSDYNRGRPTMIRLHAGSSASAVDLTLALSDLETNTSLDPAVFRAQIPEHAVPMTLDELRRAGPLGARPDTVTFRHDAPISSPDRSRARQGQS